MKQKTIKIPIQILIRILTIDEDGRYHPVPDPEEQPETPLHYEDVEELDGFVAFVIYDDGDVVATIKKKSYLIIRIGLLRFLVDHGDGLLDQPDLPRRPTDPPTQFPRWATF